MLTNISQENDLKTLKQNKEKEIIKYKFLDYINSVIPREKLRDDLLEEEKMKSKRAIQDYEILRCGFENGLGCIFGLDSQLIIGRDIVHIDVNKELQINDKESKIRRIVCCNQLKKNLVSYFTSAEFDFFYSHRLANNMKPLSNWGNISIEEIPVDVFLFCGFTKFVNIYERWTDDFWIGIHQEHLFQYRKKLVALGDKFCIWKINIYPMIKLQKLFNIKLQQFGLPIEEYNGWVFNLNIL